MATEARGRRPGFKMPEWHRPYYVYTFRIAGEVVYVGKGSGRRLKEQVKNFGYLDNCIGGVVRYFASEKAAYNEEARLIAKHKPRYNANKGGGGAITRLKHVKLSKEFKRELEEISRVGTRFYVARKLLNFDLGGFVDPSKVERIRQVAYGYGR